VVVADERRPDELGIPDPHTPRQFKERSLSGFLQWPEYHTVIRVIGALGIVSSKLLSSALRQHDFYQENFPHI
jgi:hypothetical protein